MSSEKILYLEGASGISGDMTVGALLALGADREKLLKVLESLHAGSFDIIISEKSPQGISGTDFDVQLEDVCFPDHGGDEGEACLDSEFAGGAHCCENGHGHGCGRHPHTHEADLGHCHSHGHCGSVHENGHESGRELARRHFLSSGNEGCSESGHIHRHLADVEAIIDRGQMSASARILAKKIFRIVADAESKAHGIPADQVHFHEVGAIDSIVDIVAAAVCLDDLGIQRCAVTGLTEGTGFVNCQHGSLPVPVPAVLNIAQAHGIPLRIQESVRGEMVTPTGIAIAAAIRTEKRLPGEFTVESVGIGLGKRNFGRPNILRAMIISEKTSPEHITAVECNVDDATGEELGLAMDLLMEAGARDVHFIPCYMKKNRPAWLIRVLCDGSLVPAVEKILFSQTTTIGVRRYSMERTCMERTWATAQLPEGCVKVKVCRIGNIERHYPEYESVRAAAEKSGKSLREIYAEAAMVPLQHEETHGC